MNGAELECIKNTQKFTNTHTHSHTHTHAHTHTRTQTRDGRCWSAWSYLYKHIIYTSTLLHVDLEKHPECCAVLDLQARRRGHSVSTRTTCPKFLAWCAAQLQCTTASQGTCGIGRARPPASRKGTHTPHQSSPGARAHTAPTEREPLTHGNFRSRC